MKQKYKIVEKSIILTDTMLENIPFPSGKIVFDNEIEILVNGSDKVWENSRIRVVIADNGSYWSISEYDIGVCYGYGAYHVDIEKTECKTINKLIEEVFIKGTFEDRGLGVSGIEYPTKNSKEVI